MAYPMLFKNFKMIAAKKG